MLSITKSIRAATSAVKPKSGGSGMLRTRKRRLNWTRKPKNAPVSPSTSLPNWLQPMPGPEKRTPDGVRPAQQPLGQRCRLWLGNALSRMEGWLQGHLGLLLLAFVWLPASALLISSCTTLTPPGQARMGNPYLELQQISRQGSSNPVPLLPQLDPKNSSETGKKMRPDAVPIGDSFPR